MKVHSLAWLQLKSTLRHDTLQDFWSLVSDCGLYESVCSSDDTCVLSEWFCDGVGDCAEAEDEENCG